MPRGRTRRVRREWTAQDERELKRHSKNRTPVRKISKALKRTIGALRQKARHLGIAIGHRQRPKSYVLVGVDVTRTIVAQFPLPWLDLH